MKKIMTSKLHMFISQALAEHRNKNFEKARFLYKEALVIDKNNFDALNLYGALLAETGEYEESEKLLSKALKVNPSSSVALNNRGTCRKSSGKLNLALEDYNKAVYLDSDYIDALYNRGNTHMELGLHEKAIEDFDRVIDLNPSHLMALSNKAILLTKMRRHEQGMELAEKILEIDPNHEGAHICLIHCLKALNRWDLDKVRKEMIDSKSVSILNALADAYKHCGDFERAIEYYEKAISVNNDYALAWYGKGLAFSKLNKFTDAISCLEIAIQKNRENNFGIKGILTSLLYEQLKIAQWKSYSEYSQEIYMNSGEEVVMPFLYLSLFDDPNIQYKATLDYVNKYVLKQGVLNQAKNKIHNKIRIAYFSPDFRIHPVSHLLVELFSLHNRDIFEVVAISLKKTNLEDPLLQRLVSAFDYFIDVSDKSDIEVAKITQELEIDIAVDLAGHTEGGRPDIFSLRAAPIQVAYFGYAATTGMKNIDYLIADKTVIPQENQRFFTEKIAYLPNSFMIDDRMRQPSNHEFKRDDFGIPEGKFVFCCLNMGYKFTPKILDLWARIMLDVPNSVIWISENTSFFRENILQEFIDRKISADRIFFAGRLNSMADYLARYRLADLFLDTSPYNAHTTALDALKAGLPVLTLEGNAFASRVASSLLKQVGLADLSVQSQEEYSKKAIELATSREVYFDVRQRLMAGLQSGTLFDTPLYVQNLEKIYLEMYRRHLVGDAPESFAFEDIH